MKMLPFSLSKGNKKGHPAKAECPKRSVLHYFKKRLSHFFKISSRFFACHAKSMG